MAKREGSANACSGGSTAGSRAADALAVHQAGGAALAATGVAAIADVVARLALFHADIGAVARIQRAVLARELAADEPLTLARGAAEVGPVAVLRAIANAVAAHRRARVGLVVAVWAR